MTKDEKIKLFKNKMDEFIEILGKDDPNSQDEYLDQMILIMTTAITLVSLKS